MAVICVIKINGIIMINRDLQLNRHKSIGAKGLRKIKYAAWPELTCLDEH